MGSTSLQESQAKYIEASKVQKTALTTSTDFAGKLTAFCEQCRSQEQPGYFKTTVIRNVDSRDSSGAKLSFDARSATAIRVIQKLRQAFPYHAYGKFSVGISSNTDVAQEDRFEKYEIEMVQFKFDDK